MSDNEEQRLRPILAIPKVIATTETVAKLESFGYIVIVVPTVKDLASVRLVQPIVMPVGGDMAAIIAEALQETNTGTYVSQVYTKIGAKVLAVVAEQRKRASHV